MTIELNALKRKKTQIGKVKNNWKWLSLKRCDVGRNSTVENELVILGLEVQPKKTPTNKIEWINSSGQLNEKINLSNWPKRIILYQIQSLEIEFVD